MKKKRHEDTFNEEETRFYIAELVEEPVHFVSSDGNLVWENSPTFLQGELGEIGKNVGFLLGFCIVSGTGQNIWWGKPSSWQTWHGNQYSTPWHAGQGVPENDEPLGPKSLRKHPKCVSNQGWYRFCLYHWEVQDSCLNYL